MVRGRVKNGIKKWEERGGEERKGRGWGRRKETVDSRDRWKEEEGERKWQFRA